MKSSAAGLKPKDRKLAVRKPGKKLTANQWQNTPKHTRYMELWLDPRSNLFGNAHASALEAGFSPYYANQIASPSVGNKWITEYTKKLTLTDEHIRQGIQSLAISANNAKSPDDTRLKAYEILSRINGMIDSKNTTNVVLVQPILNGSSVPKDRVIEVK